MIYHKNYKNLNLQQILDTFPHKQQVSFALSCAKSVQSLATNPTVLDCNLQVEQWLNGDKSVDLNNTRTITLNIWRNAASDSAYASASAAAAAYSAYSASYFASAAASYAAYSASSASSAAYYAASAKSFNLFPNEETKRTIAYNQFYQEYVQLAKNWFSLWTIPNFPKDEPDFPLFDFLIDYNLISYLLPKKKDYYYLNLNGFNIKHVNELELLKEINTNHIHSILRRIINNDSAQEL